MRTYLNHILLVLPLLAAPSQTRSTLHRSPQIVPAQEDQSPIMGTPSSGPTISDVIDRNQEIGIFSGFARDVSSISARFESTTKNVTVLAPEDAEIKKLPRKPWEDPKDYSTFGADAYSGQSGIDRAQQNLQRFVEAHIVPMSPWGGEKVKALAGNEVWFEMKGESKFIQPGNIEVVKVADKVANGEVWVVRGVLNYAA